MSQTVQIPRKLFDAMCSYFLTPSPDADIEANLWDVIRDGLSTKLDADLRHHLYSQFRRSPTAEERERARIAYLDAVGIPEDFRSPTNPNLSPSP